MNGQTHYGFGVAGNPLLPVSAFSAYNLLRNYNLLAAPAPDVHLKPLRSQNSTSDLALQSPLVEDPTIFPCSETDKTYMNLPSKPFLSSPLFNYPPHFHVFQSDELNSPSTNSSSSSSVLYNANFRRQRGEKKPIPDEQKDDKYYERRRRNNQAAKKSRDARKIREDQVALKATILEHENAILRAQVLTLREEASSLRQMLLQKKALELASRENQICIT